MEFRKIISPIAVVWLILAWAAPALAGEQYVDRQGRAVGGYDVVSYHLSETPMPGLDSISAEYNGATWLFATQANRALFLADPERYAPAFDGHCVFSAANDGKGGSDPMSYLIEDDRLYMAHSRRVRDRVQRRLDVTLEDAEDNWAKLEVEPAARPWRGWFRRGAP